MSASLAQHPSQRTLDARRRITARILAGLMALQLVSPAWADSYQIRVPANISPEALLPDLAVTPAQIDFGDVTVGDTAMASSTLINKGTAPASLSFSSVPAPYAFNHDCVNPLPGGQNCSLNFTFTPAVSAPQPDASLSISGGKTPVLVTLKGNGSLPLAAIGELKANTSSDFGTVTLGSTQQRSFTFKNVGGLPASGIYAQIPAATGLTLVSNNCGTQASPITLAANGKCSVTLSFGGSVSAALTGASLAVQGSFENSPQSIALSGTAGEFNATAVWSSNRDTTTALTSADTIYDTLTPNSTVTNVGLQDKNFYLRNTGTNGPIAVQFNLSGDTEHFSIQSVRLYATGNCYAGDGVSTPCVAADIKNSSTASILYVKIRYQPKAIGNHTITVTPSTNNGTALPAPITLTGSAQFNPTAVWSSNRDTTTALTSADTTYATLTANGAGNNVGYQDKILYLRNTGTNGAIAARFNLSGDTEHFSIQYVRLYNTSWGCNAGDGIASPCVADDVKTGSVKSTIYLQIRYQPKAVGSHTLTVTPSTNNGTVLPAPITLTGAAQ